MIRFPEKFLWGAATSSYQVEGGNSNADWWRWEIQTGRERSGDACRHYELYEQDFDLARGLDHNAHRLSIEWSRVEPAEGEFSEEALRHYLDVILALKARGIEPLVTLHHFTNPIWFSDMGGWESRCAVRLFLRYCGRLVRKLAPHVRYWITVNEPTIYISHGYILGIWPPQVRSLLRAKRVEENFVRAHNGCCRLIRELYSEAGLARPMVGMAQHMQAFVPCAATLRNRLAAYLRDTWYNLRLINAFTRAGTLDFIGINYYSRQVVAVRRWGISNMAMDTCREQHHPVKKNSLGWDIYPEGFYRLLVSLGRYRLPVIVTENGICTQDDDLRWEFIAAHLSSVHRAIARGVDVRGYLYWSLMDNFEWDKGFVPRFGLLAVEYPGCKRTVRGSALQYARVCRTGVLEQ